MSLTDKFVANYSTYTHYVAGVFTALILAYSQVPAFHTLVQNVYHTIPAGVQQLALAGVGLYAWYHNGQHTTPPPVTPEPPPTA